MVSQNQLGLMYSKGQGVAEDNKQARKWLQKVRKQSKPRRSKPKGLAFAQLTPSPRPASNPHRSQSVDAGYEVAMINLGEIYLRGMGVTPSYKKGRDLFTSAARLGAKIPKEDLEHLAAIEGGMKRLKMGLGTRVVLGNSTPAMNGRRGVVTDFGEDRCCRRCRRRLQLPQDPFYSLSPVNLKNIYTQKQKFLPPLDDSGVLDACGWKQGPIRGGARHWRDVQGESAQPTEGVGQRTGYQRRSQRQKEQRRWRRRC